MEIATHHVGEVVELRLRGLLDNNWAGQLSQAIDDVVRQGTHRLLVNLAEVTYLSSAGVGALLQAHRRLQAIHGFLGVCDPSPPCAEVIRLMGLSQMLICDAAQVRQQGAGAHLTVQPEFRLTSQQGVNFEIYDLKPQATLECLAFGNPEQLARGGYTADNCRLREFPNQTCGVGLGALGENYAVCRSRFGEFLAVAGNIAQQPAIEGYSPDYQLSREDFQPHIQTLYGVQCTGVPARLVRFEPANERRPLGFSQLVEQVLTTLETDLAGMTFIAETSGLIGAALKRAPTSEPVAGAGLFAHPEIRQWLSFTPEHMHPRTLALVTGVAARSRESEPVRALRPWLRPLFGPASPWGHFHAAVFSYRALKKGKLDLETTARSLFESEALHAVLHLLGDDREIIGVGESEFVSGACWATPIAKVHQEGAK